MFSVIYEFHVKAGENQRFEKAWLTYTEALYRVKGSLGSRLHKTSDEQVYVAYAQWPSQAAFDAPNPIDQLRAEELRSKEVMMETLIKSETKYKLDLLKDAFKVTTASGSET